MFFAEVEIRNGERLAEEEKKETAGRVWWRDEINPGVGIIKEGKMEEEQRKDIKTSIIGDGEDRHTGNSK